MRIKVWYCIVDCGDGSCIPKFFRTEKEAEKEEAYQLECYGQGPTEAVGSHIFDTEDYDEV